MCPSFDYQEDLAYVHHTGYADFAQQAAPHLIRLLRERGVAGGLVVDLGCGSGLWARELLRAGYEVLGVDSSPAMVELAQRTAPEARFVAASLYDFALPRCDAVTALGEVLNYIPPGEEKSPGLFVELQKIGKALRPGGVLLFDLLVQTVGEPMAYRHWSAGDGWAVLVEVAEDKTERQVQREITTFRQVGELYRRSHETHRVHVQARYQVERYLTRAGFSVQVSNRYGDFELAPRRLVFQARKVRKG